MQSWAYFSSSGECLWSLFGSAFAAVSVSSSCALLAVTLPLRYCSTRFVRRIPFWTLPVPGHVAGLITAELEVAQVDEVKGARREVHWVSGSGQEFENTAHLVGLNMQLVGVCGRGCMVLGTLVFPVLIARGGDAISMIWVTVLFIPGSG